jgi:hypothetical protein
MSCGWHSGTLIRSEAQLPRRLVDVTAAARFPCERTMKVPVRELTVGDILRVNDWQLHVIAVEHDAATAVLTSELGFLLHFTRDEIVDIRGKAVREPAAA